MSAQTSEWRAARSGDREISAESGRTPLDLATLADRLDAQAAPSTSSGQRVAARIRRFERGDQVELASSLVATLEASGPVVHTDGSMWRYAAPRGLYETIPGHEQSRIVQGYAGSFIATKPPKELKIDASDVRGAITLAGDRVARPDFFAGAPRGLVFADSFVRVSANGVQLAEHSPDHRARYCYPFPYHPAVPRTWLAFLERLFRDDPDRVERIAFVQEFFGACLVGIAPVYAKCLVAVGAGENGKSRMGEILSSAFPRGSTTAVPPQLFEQEYRRAKLAGKLLNFVAELPEAEILDSESFKAIVAGDTIQARPIREAPFDFAPVAGHYFAANRLPGSNDTTHAFWRRFVVLTFSRTFREGDADRDPDIHTKIIAAELPAIVPWLLEGAARVLRQGGYTIPPSHAAALASWKLCADQVALFLHERTVPSTSARPEWEHDWTPAAGLYGTYRQWAEDEAGHRPPLARNKFGTRLAAVGTPWLKNERGAFYGVRVLRPKREP